MPYLTPICQYKLEPHKEKVSSFSGSSNDSSTVTTAINSDPTKQKILLSEELSLQTQRLMKMKVNLLKICPYFQ